MVSSLCLICFGLISCQRSRSFTPIAQLSPSPQAVLVQGIVRDRAPFLNQGAYQLQDESGSIWVFTNQPLPDQDQAVTIEAKIKTKSIVISNQEFQEVYLQEEKLTSINN